MASKKPAAKKVAAKTSTQARSDGQKRRKANEAAELITRRWAMARAKFEQDPTVTFASVARELDVSRQAVQLKAKAEGWVKRQHTAAQLADAAHVVADQTPPPALVDSVIPPHPTRPPRPEPPADKLAPPASPPDLGPEAQALAVLTRAEVLTRHRHEWRIARGLLQEAVRSRDFGKGKLAKIVSEGLQIIQNGERKAYGLDQPEATPPGGQATIRVVVEREGAAPAVTVERGEVVDG